MHDPLTTGGGDDGDAPLLLFLPAMGVPASFYAPFAGRLQAIGVTIEVPELPGQGESPLRASRGDDYGYREVVEDLIPDALHRLARRFPQRPCLLGGHSLGGQLALLASGALSPSLHGLLLVAAGTAHWRAWPAGRRARAAMAVHAISGAARVLPWYPGRRLGFGGDQPRRFMRDWSRNARTGVYALEGSRHSPEQLRRALAEVALPVLSVGVQGDPLAPPSAAQALCQLLPAARIRSEMVSGVASDPPWRRHFSWARQPGGVESVVSCWLAEVLAPLPMEAEAF